MDYITLLLDHYYRVKDISLSGAKLQDCNVTPAQKPLAEMEGTLPP